MQLTRLTLRVGLLLLAAPGWGLAPAGAEDEPEADRDRERMVVGELEGGRVVVPTNQVLTPAGRLVTFPGRPVDLVLVGDRRTVAVKNRRDLLLLDAETGTILQTLRLRRGGHSVGGLAVADDGATIYSSGVRNLIHVAVRDGDQRDAPYRWDEPLTMPTAPNGLPDTAPTGLALTRDDEVLLALSGRGNVLWRFDRDAKAVVGEPIPVGVAPFAVVLASDTRAYVSNWGGEPPGDDDPQEPSAKTMVKVDPRTGAAAEGSVSVVDLEQGRTIRSIPTGRHPGGLAVSPDRQFVYVACADSDTVEVIDTRAEAIVETIPVRPRDRLPFGSGPNALAVAPGGDRLYVANGTNNAVAVVALGPKASTSPAGEGESRVLGLIPVGWYPGAVAFRMRERARRPSSSRGEGREQLVVANIKGQGSRDRRRESGYSSHDHLGSVSLLPVPDASRLAESTRQVAANNREALALAGLEPPRPDAPPRPVPERHGEPSPIRHVLYIIKENRTYDQVFGDLTQGNGDPKLVLFGREVTPNQHALAEQFVLLDNFYCAGVLSADGHAWATEAYANDYLERHFGGFIRSYPYDGDDPLAYAPTGFLWDNALAHGLTFRDYGEFVKAVIEPGDATWKSLYHDYLHSTNKVKVRARPGVPTLRDYLCPTYVGFPGTVPDVYRAREFLKEFRECERKGELPNLIVMLLPNDHTEGTRPGMPTPRAMVADNDLALGRIVEAVTHSRFWPETAIFVCEDDSQSGFDHVDGHRTIAQVISPYTRRGAVDHSFYSQVGMVKTMELMLGLPPMNQLDLAARPLRHCFRAEPDLRPFDALLNEVPLDEMNAELSRLSGPRRSRAEQSLKLDLDDVDRADEDTLNRILWHAIKGDDVPYPRLAHAHGDDEDEALD